MKRIIFATALTIGLLGLTACGSGGDSEIVVKSKAGNITKEEFYEELKAQNGEDVLRQLVTFKVLEDKYEVTDEQIEEELASLREQVGDDFEEMLEMQGLTEDDLKADIKKELLQTAALTEGIEVTDDEIKIGRAHV